MNNGVQSVLFERRYIVEMVKNKYAYAISATFNIRVKYAKSSNNTKAYSYELQPQIVHTKVAPCVLCA